MVPALLQGWLWPTCDTKTCSYRGGDFGRELTLHLSDGSPLSQTGLDLPCATTTLHLYRKANHPTRRRLCRRVVASAVAAAAAAVVVVVVVVVVLVLVLVVVLVLVSFPSHCRLG